MPHTAIASPDTYYINGDNPRGIRVIKPPIVYLSCNWPALPRGNSTCNRCCSEPDVILHDLFVGPDPFGTKSLDEWYIQDLWPLIQAKIQTVSNDVNAATAARSASLGTLYDSQNNARSILALQKGQARAATTFMSGEALCRFATLAQGLGASEQNANAIKINMNDRSFDRQLLKANVTAGEDVSVEDAKTKNMDPQTRGQNADKIARWKAYETVFCNPASNNGQGKDGSGDGICKSSSDEQYNADVNYTRTFDAPDTLEIGTGVGLTKDVQNLNALADNLYGHDIMNNAQSATALDPKTGSSEEIRKYMIMRSAIAKRAVAEGSFSSIAAMKAKGTTGSAAATQNLLIELGMDKDEAKRFVGDNPSYYAQMEALTRRLYQSPTFYVNLMEGPVNVKRQQAAMKSLELMQQRDIYKSMQRSEMLLATLLDIYVTRQQGGLGKNAVQGSK